jgi:flagellar basal body-associated protein FliL|tara:strand:+ start:308 stop:523 length:216 start_codon:yes stop_codon:yes gene_type:complete
MLLVIVIIIFVVAVVVVVVVVVMMMTLFPGAFLITASWCKKSSKIRKKVSHSSQTQISILRPLITFFFYAR